MQGSSSKSASAGKRGFTLVELLVVIGIIAVLMGILMPVLSRAREQARRTKCAANLMNIGKAAQSFATAHNGFFPMAYRCPLVQTPDVKTSTVYVPGVGNKQATITLYDYVNSSNYAYRFPMFITMVDFPEETPPFYGANGTSWNVWVNYGLTQATITCPSSNEPAFYEGSSNGAMTGVRPSLSGNPVRNPGSVNPPVSVVPPGGVPSNYGDIMVTNYMYVGGMNTYQKMVTSTLSPTHYQTQTVTDSNGNGVGSIMQGIQHWGTAPPAVRTSDQKLDQAVLAADMVFWTGGPAFSWYGQIVPDYQINHPHAQTSDQIARTNWLPDFQNVLYGDGHVSSLDYGAYTAVLCGPPSATNFPHLDNTWQSSNSASSCTGTNDMPPATPGAMSNINISSNFSFCSNSQTGGFFYWGPAQCHTPTDMYATSNIVYTTIGTTANTPSPGFLKPVNQPPPAWTNGPTLPNPVTPSPFPVN